MTGDGGQPLLELRDVEAAYGNIVALKGVSLAIRAGEIVTLIGANGAGKSTTLKTISGLLHPRAGSVRFEGVDIAEQGLTPAQITRRGIVQVPEGRRIFTRLTVQENLEMGAYIREAGEALDRDYEDVYRRFPRLLERRKQLGGTLSGGEQQMLAIGRALLTRPRVLLLDEPSMGLAPLMVKEIFRVIRDINEQGVTILLVEQNARQALQIAHRGYVIETGHIVMEDDAKKLLASDAIRKAYLGE